MSWRPSRAASAWRSRSSSRLLRARYPDRLPAIVVDDAHLLDGGSAALVLALATTGAARLVVTIRSGEPAPDAITALWKERGLERIELQPLGPPDVRRLVAALLAGSVHTAAHERIYDLSQGNPLFIRELVHDARRTGALHLRDGRWRWREELVTFERLRVLVERRTLDVSAHAQSALELIALGAPLPLAVVGALSSHGAVEELERLGLVAVRGAGPAAEVRLEHPLYGEVVAARMPATTRMRLRRWLAVALQRVPRLDDGGSLRIAVWLMDAGETEPELFVRASALAVARGDPALGLRLAEAAGDGFGAVIAVGVALNALARFDRAEAVLAPHESAAATMDEPSSWTYVDTRFRALLRGGATETALHGLLDRAAAWHDGRGWDAVVATQRGWVELYRSRPAAALEAVGPLLADESLSALQQFHVHAVAMNARARLGLTDQCLEAAAQDARSRRAPRSGAVGGAVRDAHVRAAPVHRGRARSRRASRLACAPPGPNPPSSRTTRCG